MTKKKSKSVKAVDFFFNEICRGIWEDGHDTIAMGKFVVAAWQKVYHRRLGEHNAFRRLARGERHGTNAQLRELFPRPREAPHPGRRVNKKAAPHTRRPRTGENRPQRTRAPRARSAECPLPGRRRGGGG